jgi:predicted RNase H-like nuclease (RuvC/YqgF family)
LNDRFQAIGFVPSKSRNEVFACFKKAMDDKYASLKLEANEKEMILYKGKVETLLASPDRTKLLSQERFELKKQMDVLNKEIIQMETNLSFFARSKGAEQLRKDVEKKIEGTKEKINGLKRKLSSLPNE